MCKALGCYYLFNSIPRKIKAIELQAALQLRGGKKQWARWSYETHHFTSQTRHQRTPKVLLVQQRKRASAVTSAARNYEVQ